jgi:hypothetical protein
MPSAVAVLSVTTPHVRSRSQSVCTPFRSWASGPPWSSGMKKWRLSGVVSSGFASSFGFGLVLR